MPKAGQPVAASELPPGRDAAEEAWRSFPLYRCRCRRALAPAPLLALSARLPRTCLHSSLSPSVSCFSPCRAVASGVISYKSNPPASLIRSTIRAYFRAIVAESSALSIVTGSESTWEASPAISSALCSRSRSCPMPFSST